MKEAIEVANHVALRQIDAWVCAPEVRVQGYDDDDDLDEDDADGEDEEDDDRDEGDPPGWSP